MDFEPNKDFNRQWSNGMDCLGVLQEATDRIHNVFDTIAPRRTGNTVARTHPVPRRTGQNGWEIELISNIYYARFVEHGTRYMAAQRNLENAMRIVQQET